MDLVAEMVLKNLHANHTSDIQATRVCPKMERRFNRFPMFSNNYAAYNVDRLINRFWDYPALLKRIKGDFDLFHVVDHSYGQLLHVLPHNRTIVTCHDLDTFRCILEPTHHRRSRLFREMAKRILSGFRKAARVICDSIATRDQLLEHELFPPKRVAVIPLGVHPTCSPEPDALTDAEAERLLGPADTDQINILHVGSTIPRKRIDVLLRIFAALHKEFPRARLLRVGGPFTATQLKFIDQLALKESVIVLPFLGREVLGAIYRRAALVLLTSEAEGFGLPVIEALACGTPVVASDLPVLREVGGRAASYCPVADVDAWSQVVIELLRERREQPDQWSRRRAEGIAQASRFTWAEYTRQMVRVYQEVLSA